MENADTAPDTSGATGAAPGAELSIPKHRFDEVRADLARLREEVGVKDRLILETQQRMLQNQQPSGPSLPTAEESGLDPHTYQAVMKIADRIVESKMASKEALFGQQIGLLASRTEKAELLASKGSDKAKYLAEIKKMQMDHNRETGGFMPAETCLEILQSREKDRRIAELEAKLAGGNVQTTSQVQQPSSTSVPNSAATRQMPTGGGGVTPKSFNDLTVDEMEARLQEQFTAGEKL